ncbi:MAG: hypothetical protein HC903_13195 [Methylacidiphilales bacterium]|nr:hypothetical protein [Candidatus Methylacidiphilales bacterium]NJR16437.1 hypothetical protein [Calothrix sp. CSU_2_0]
MSPLGGVGKSVDGESSPVDGFPANLATGDYPRGKVRVAGDWRSLLLKEKRLARLLAEQLPGVLVGFRSSSLLAYLQKPLRVYPEGSLHPADTLRAL